MAQAVILGGQEAARSRADLFTNKAIKAQKRCECLIAFAHLGAFGVPCWVDWEEQAMPHSLSRLSTKYYVSGEKTKPKETE